MPQKLSFNPKQLAIVGGALVIFGVLLFAIMKGGKNVDKPPQLELLVWGFEEESIFDELARGYMASRPNVKINYKKIEKENYRERLLDALAKNEGPDIFPLSNYGLLRELDKLVPAPPLQFNLANLRSSFPTVVENDFSWEGKVYALPSFIDTLALFYNRDTFDQAGIVFPPKTWEEFLADVQVLRVLNEQGQLVKAAAAIGGTEETIDFGVDIVHLLMLQNGAKMVSDDLSRATFADIGQGNLGLEAFNFYLQFTNTASPYFTWDESLGSSLLSFASGKTAMIFNYRSAVPKIKKLNPFLNFEIAPMPQIRGARQEINYSRYFGWAVSKQSKWPTWAWDFIIYLTTDPQTINKYFIATGNPPAFRKLIEINLNDPNFGVFARQALTARSWRQVNEEKIRAIFNSAIKKVLTGRFSSSEALRQAQEEVSLLMKQ